MNTEFFLNLETIHNNINDLINKLSIHGYRIFWIYIPKSIINSNTPVICLRKKYLKDILGINVKGGDVSLKKGINELIDLKVIKPFPQAGRGFYMVNRNWFPIGSLDNQESF